MPWAELDHTRQMTVPRKPRATQQAPKLVLYKDGLAKLNAAARAAIPHDGTVHLHHDPERPALVGIGVRGEHPHRLSKTGTLSAVPLWRHAGRPSGTMHVPLAVQGDLLVGDLSAAVLSPPRGSGTVAGSEAGRPAAAKVHSPAGSVDGNPARPEASAPSDSSLVDVLYEPAEDYEEAVY